MEFAKQNKPLKFSDIVGHKNNIKAFTSKARSLDFDYPSVCFLEGLSGTGKTSSANIIAMTVNCENPVMNELGYYDPCLECTSCKSVLTEKFNSDILYFNGGAFTSSEEQRKGMAQLEEYASLSPWHGGRKTVIIIDEFQELSGKAKSSALDLLGRVRKDTLFILCTMDVATIDKAILSRGQVYKFSPLSTEEIGSIILAQLQLIDPEELLPFKVDALLLLAQNCWGSARQALQYLERCIDSEMYDVTTIEKELGFLSDVKAFSMLTKLINKDPDFYSDIGSVKEADFYTYSWSILSRINKTLLVLDKDDWKYKSSFSMSSNPNYKSLIETYLKINEGCTYYFKDYIFNLFIGEYIKSKTEVPILNKIQEQPRTRQPRSS